MTRGDVMWLLAAVAVVAVVSAVIVLRLLRRLLRARRLLEAAGVRPSTKLLVWGSIAYTVWPVDLLPDPVYLDDIGFLLLALRAVHRAGARIRISRGEAGGKAGR
ncbi:DUF1232 domain-containing protein [Streptomyces sp. HPF1205]|uniref:DUF1232 domain-containing protein n=1 Tax=Streptomyces sp. HPF1205 TaxID=2873262 RepID=UPI001CED4C4B|nr:YkvA family protein [Streptomyces sp. HPF1205]